MYSIVEKFRVEWSKSLQYARAEGCLLRKRRTPFSPTGPGFRYCVVAIGMQQLLEEGREAELPATKRRTVGHRDARGYTDKDYETALLAIYKKACILAHCMRVAYMALEVT